VLADRQHPDIQLLHRRRRVAKRLVRANNLDVTMHDLVDLHANLLELPARDSGRHPPVGVENSSSIARAAGKSKPYLR
jgi:hypothetical protein